MPSDNFKNIFTQDVLKKIFPENRADLFFDALYGDATEGAYDICLDFEGSSENELNFRFLLKQRQNKCLACNLTYGLPNVFSRHPILNLNGLVKEINQTLKGKRKCNDWKLGRTREISSELHVIPLTIYTDA